MDVWHSLLTLMKALRTLAAAAALNLPILTIAAPIQVLIVDGQNNHKWEFTTPVLKHALEQSGAFEVKISTTPAKGAPISAWEAWKPKFRDFAVVVSNYNGQPWPEGVRADFETYVRSGGGFVSVHAANNAFPEWKAYNEMIGVGGWGGRNEQSGPWLYVKDGKLYRDIRPGAGGAHGPQHEFVVEIQDSLHPITRGLPSRWLHCKDELYSRLRGPAENLQILATAKSDLTAEQEPNLMVIQHGQGRVMHTTLGHADYSMLDRGFYEILERGVEWAATGQVVLTAALPADFPTEAKTSVVVLGGHPKQTPPPAK